MSRLAALRVNSGSCVPWRAQGVATANTTGGWQDKRAHIARRSGWGFCPASCRIWHIAAPGRNVRGTAKALYLCALLHIAGQRHGR